MPTLRRKFATRAPLALALLLVGGCDLKGCRDDNSSGLPDSTRLDDLPTPTFGETTVAGVVTFDGPVTEPTVIGTSPQCGDMKDESVLVSSDGGLANVLVYLDDAPASSGVGRDPVTLNQDGCRFEPRVLGVQIGQPLEVSNDDPMRHNVHYTPERNRDTNLAFEPSDPPRTERFGVPEASPVRVKCDIHPWMAAHVGVFAHPFYGVTDSDGGYAIDRVPAGDYTLVAWHEVYGKQEQPIVVADATTIDANFRYGRPQ